ncbi:MAG: anti-sigma regulatory factor [Actinomycetota bacterium]
MPDTVTVTVPPDPGFLHILRQLTGGVAARIRLTIDDIEDLKLAVDEAASSMLTRLPASSEITLALDTDDATLRATVSSDAPTEGWPIPGLLDSLSWKVITGLVGEASAERDESGRPSIVLLKRTLTATER